MSQRYTRFKDALVSAVLGKDGASDQSMRRFVRSAAASGAITSDVNSSIPSVLRNYLHKVTCYAYKVTDSDVEDIRKQGFSEDEIFELTVAAALGAGLARLERGLALLEQSPQGNREVNYEAK